MEKYIGTKVIEAEPMTRAEYQRSLKNLGPLACNGQAPDPNETGYSVKYPDGYMSWSPASAFEPAYHKASDLNFGEAISAMKQGAKVARKGWNGKGIFIELQVPDAHSKMTSPYIFIDTTGLQTNNPDAPKSRVPWLASQTDMLAEDWIIA